MERRGYQSPKIDTYTISPELKGRGVFYDTHETLRESGELADFVFKEFHLDLLFSRESAVDLFSKQEEEHEVCKKYFPEEMVPRTVFIVPQEFEPQYERAKVDTSRIYPYYRFGQIQLNRRLAGRYGLDERFEDREKKLLNRAFRAIGKQLEKLKEKKFTAALVQERVNGISFGELFKRPDWQEEKNYPLLRENVKKLLDGLNSMHEKEPNMAYTWHSLESDNVTVEMDKDGHITGRVVIIDTNFIQRPDRVYKKVVVKKLEEQILKPLEESFGID